MRNNEVAHFVVEEVVRDIRAHCYEEVINRTSDAPITTHTWLELWNTLERSPLSGNMRIDMDRAVYNAIDIISAVD